MTGSSPRMRGTLCKIGVRFLHRGIIPAYAGNTSLPTAPWPSTGDHPRVCGEHPPKRCPSTDLWGSSPRMRGTPDFRECDVSGLGIIPAYAGNTSRRGVIRKRFWDHPRVCGEHICSGSYVITVPGSSPRMRGTRSVGRAVCRGLGIIPAYAGNTRSRRNRRNPQGDHPRVCGEHAATSTGVACG